MSITVTDYFTNDLIDYAAYDNIRKIPSYIDGLKMSQRKIVYTLFKKYPKEFVKTETLANIAAAFTNYLHGASNLTIVCATMTQDFVGTNNYNLTTGNSGGWGCRINPTVAAPRYTRLKLSDVTNLLFSNHDEKIIGRQFFEGDYIEPKFFVPVFPVLLLNGSNGLSTGFSCTIYPRNPESIAAYIKRKLDGVEKPRVDLRPWFRGFNGTVRVGENGGYESVGVVKRLNTTNYEITELPIGMEYQKYITILDKLCEDKVIVDYDDCCEPKTDTILFKVKTTRQFTNQNDTPAKLEKVFKLARGLAENLNCIDENNRVREFGSVEEILDAYIDVRLKFYGKRKEFLIEQLKRKLTVAASKYLFIKCVVTGKIKVAKMPKEEIVKQLKSHDNIKEVDGSYDYLLNMPIYSLTKEQMEKLAKEIDELKKELIRVASTEANEMWTDDLKVVTGKLKKL